MTDIAAEPHRVSRAKRNGHDPGSLVSKVDVAVAADAAEQMMMVRKMTSCAVVATRPEASWQTSLSEKLLLGLHQRAA